MAKIIIDNVNLGGLADSIYLGVKGSVAAMAGLDLHSTPGVIKVNQKLTKESSTTITVRINCMIQASNGNTYAFGNSGKIYSRIAGVWALEATAAPAAGSANITGAIEDQGKIYYFMESRVGRWLMTDPWSGRNDSWATFTGTDASYHPAVTQNQVVYIGDGRYIAQIEDDVFTGNALDMKVGIRTKSLGKLITELLIGTFIQTDSVENDIFRWNTWSESFTSNDPVSEAGVDAFLPTDNFNLVAAGTKGNIYAYSNDRLERFMRIPGDWSLTKKAQVHFWATANYFGLPLFGLSNVANNPALQGIYSIGGYSQNYPRILNLEHIASCGSNNVEITAMCMAGDVLLVAWYDGTNYGVDKLDATAKYASAFLESRAIIPDRELQTRYPRILVCYKSLPAGTGVVVKANINHAGFGTALAQKVDADRKIIETSVDVGGANTLQIRIEPTVSSNDAPEIERIEIITQD